MNPRRSLHLVKETVIELTTDEMASVIGGTIDPTEICNPCIFTWSCDHGYSLKCG